MEIKDSGRRRTLRGKRICIEGRRCGPSAPFFSRWDTGWVILSPAVLGISDDYAHISNTRIKAVKTIHRKVSHDLITSRPCIFSDYEKRHSR